MLNQSKNIFNSGKTIFSAVMDGKVTGQINTARFLLKILGENIDESRLVLLEQPEKSKMFFFNWVKYLANFAKTSYFNNINIQNYFGFHLNTHLLHKAHDKFLT